jgi:hypothetical protein
MKKTIFLLFLLVGFGYSASAQISGGIKGGLNFANVDVDGDPDGRTGYHVGVFASIGAAGIFIQPELLYSAKGAEDFDLSYIEIPILLRKNFAKVLNIHLGPQFGILTSAESDFGTGSVDVKDELKGADLSAVFGAGVNLPGGLSAGGRYVLGLSDIDDGFGTEIKNRTFQIYVGYKLFGN